LPVVGRPSRYFAEASLTVFRSISAEVPPMTMARWYGGQAAVPSVLIFSSRNAAALRVEQRLRLLEQEALVGRAAALGHEQELVLVAVGRGHLDLRRQVGAGVDLLLDM
jgi:hypothetical protein